MPRQRQLSSVSPSEARSGSENADRDSSQGAPQVEQRPTAGYLQVVRAVAACADADTSAQKEGPGMARGQSASPKALRQASTGPSGCQPGLQRTVRDLRTLGSRQRPQALKSRLERLIRSPPSSPNRGR